MGDPSQTVPQELMPHVHLISSFRYPAMARLDLPEVAKWLMSAPQIARDKAPFFWTYLDKPADSTILLTWQPQGRLGTNFATDGFVWAPPEQIYKHELGPGLLLEIYYLKAGYIPGEQVATHARRRFRLIATQAHPNPSSVDSSLFIVHYGPSEPNDRMPATMVPYDERVNTIMQQRHFLLRSGQIRRKEFMLSDRVNWPSLPELTRQQMGPQATPRGVPQQMAYPTSTPTGPPAKRARHGHNQSQAPPGAPPGLDVLDDEEDNSRGDMFDHISPRELSVSRYQQNHEWMEEILSSGYRVGQISPSDLGLGLKGELAALTEGIFTAQGGEALASLPEKSYVGKLDEGQADEFRKRVNDYIESTKSEISQMEKEHAEALAKFKKSSLIRIKERELKSVREETGPEVWRIEGRVDVTDDGNEDRRLPATKQTIDDIVKDVELDTGKTIDGKPSVHRVQAGGFQEPVPEPSPEPEPQLEAVPASTEEGEKRQSRQPSHAGSQNDGLVGGESDLDMGDTAAGLLDQMHSGFSSTSTPNNNFPTPQAQLSAGQSNAATPANAQGQSPVPAAGAASEPAAVDVQMGGTDAATQKQEAQPQQAQQTDDLQAKEGEAATAPDQGTESGDWVVVPKESANESTGEARPAEESTKAEEAVGTTTAAATGLSAAATPAVTDGGGAVFDQNDFNSLEDLDSAGDALAGFEGSGGGLGEGLDLQMDMEDSAFGDAFHGVGSGTPGGEEQNQDM